MIEKKSFAIVGGGIGGLTIAIALQKKGFSAKVYENAPSLKPLGAGIVLAANAMKAFRAIGIDEEIRKAGRELKRFSIRDIDGRLLRTTEAEKVNLKYGLVNTITLHRAELHKALLDQLTPGTLLLNKGCSDFVRNGDKVTLSFNDGTSSKEDYVIAADGIHSVFRQKLLPQIPLRYSGYTCWRAVIDNLPDHFNSEEASETWGPGMRFGIVPLSRNRIYWYATVDAEPGDQRFLHNNAANLAKIFKNFHSPVTKILSLTSDDRLIRNDIADFQPIKQFAFDNIVLLGDAAHATTPNLGQGACMAIEDGVVLADCIEKGKNPLDGFRLFEDLRIRRTTRIVNASYNMGRVAQLKNPLLMWLRNAAIRMTPEAVAEKQLRFLNDVSFS
jgi:2-polyprenyl-6-methoxyphenol hydroxylase-like FAD-dependent oxidoreductase